jgi:23S rRNA G2445 N2-methylase RlmL
LPPGRGRAFGFAQTRLFEASLWEEVQRQAEARALPAPRVLASDRRADLIAAAVRNATHAGVAADVHLATAALAESPCRGELAGAGAVVSDPPHGRRLGDTTALVKLYRALGGWLQTAPPSCGIALLSGDRRLTLRTGLRLETAFLASQGGAKVRALVRPAAVSGAAPA